VMLNLLVKHCYFICYLVLDFKAAGALPSKEGGNVTFTHCCCGMKLDLRFEGSTFTVQSNDIQV
jgi:hypothetical protein